MIKFVQIFLFAVSFAVTVLASSGGYATTVRYPQEFRYDINGKIHSLWYVHEQWDVDAYGFVIDCDVENLTYLTVTYNLLRDGAPAINLKAMKRRNDKPKLVVRASTGRIRVIGEIEVEEENQQEVFRFRILNGSDIKNLMLQRDVELEFTNKRFRLWRIKNSAEITNFFHQCAAKSF